MMWVRAAAFGAFLTLACGSGAVIAAEPSGEAVAVIQSTAVQGPSGSRALAAKAPVFMGDLVKTDKAGQAQILFRDDTRLVVGPNSELTIDRFVVASPSTAREFTINATRGVFRFITGTSQKQVYKINTPTATIGVRGTRFDLTLLENSANLALYEGGVRFCDRTGPRLRCADIEGTCTVVVLDPERQFRWIQNLAERTRFMETVFPMAFDQSALKVDFRVQSGSCNVRDFTPQGRGREKREPPQSRDKEG